MSDPLQRLMGYTGDLLTTLGQRDGEEGMECAIRVAAELVAARALLEKYRDLARAADTARGVLDNIFEEDGLTEGEAEALEKLEEALAAVEKLDNSAHLRTIDNKST